MSKEFRTSVGGQALMEGIMMRGPEKICCAAIPDACRRHRHGRGGGAS